MQIDLDRYPELRRLCWSRPNAKTVTGEEALSLYERNWRLVDGGTLTEDERRLIDTLVETHGNGVFMPT